MPMVATQKPYTLFVVPDDEPTNPREELDNFGTMVCFHRRYTLGDEHHYDDAEEFFQKLVQDSISDKDVISYVKDGNVDGLKLEYNKSEHTWELHAYSDYFKKWFTEYTLPAPLKGNETDLSEAILEQMKWQDLKDLAEKTHCILPVYMYDHSGLTVNTTGFSCPWDSGLLGWIYVCHDKVKEEFGEVTSENIRKAEKLLVGEVKDYDYYLTGQCYGFRLYKQKKEIDNCWGFLGDFKDVQDSIKGYLPDECKEIVEILQERWDNASVENILEEILEQEDEGELDYGFDDEFSDEMEI
ncbi:hypothetical protein [Dehalobacter restrictus]|jgi:hypothetical protein|uniref:hypothetical protein n=1 Tax=Dehalobacter restrictus TaxID=55583 RepID=UPI00338E2BE5